MLHLPPSLYSHHIAVRINQERTLILSNWKLNMSVSLRHVGGTISEGCLSISHKEDFLAAWPYGFLEIYDFKAMNRVLTNKVSRAYRIPLIKFRCILLRGCSHYLKDCKAKIEGFSNKIDEGGVIDTVVNLTNASLFREIVMFL
jgi:hypothetical protein